MDKEPLSLVIVATEKELKTIIGALRGLSRKIPLQYQFATQAIEGPAAMNRIIDKTGKLDACFFHHRFTVPGKEPYSEVLAKTLKRKYPNCPIIGFGKKNKAGSKGKHFHEFLETDEDLDYKELLEILLRLQDGDIETKKVKKQYRRLSDMEEGKTGTEDENKKKDPFESKAFPSNPSFRQNSMPISISQPGSPSSPYLNNSMVYSATSSPIATASQGSPFAQPMPAPKTLPMSQAEVPCRSGQQTPTGVRTPTSPYSSGQIFLNGTPNAELIHQLSQELEKLKNMIMEKKAKDSSPTEFPRHLEVKTTETMPQPFPYAIP